MRILFLACRVSLDTHLLAAVKTAGFVADHVATPEDADEALCSCPYAAIFVGNAIPGAAAPWIMRHRRAMLSTPILVQLETDTALDRIAAFEAGADDCFRAPIVARELVARLRAVLRRPPLIDRQTLAAGNATLDPETREVWVAGRRINVPRREVSLLEQLMRRFTRVVPRMQLEANLYGMDDEVAPNSIEVGVSRIRRRLLDADANVAIQTVRGIGYRLGHSSRDPSFELDRHPAEHPAADRGVARW